MQGIYDCASDIITVGLERPAESNTDGNDTEEEGMQLWEYVQAVSGSTYR